MHLPKLNKTKVSKNKNLRLLIPLLAATAARFACAASAVNKVTASYYFSPYGCNLSVFGDSECVGAGRGDTGGSESGNQMLLDRIFMKEIVCDSLNTPPSQEKPPRFFVYGNAGTLLSGGTPATATPRFPHNPGGFLAGFGDQGMGLSTALLYQELY